MGLVGAVGGIVGCTSTGGRGSTDPLRLDPSVSPPPSTSPWGVALPKPQPWAPSANDVAADAKARAVRLVETAATWESGNGGFQNARRRLNESGFDGDLVDDLGSVLVDGVESVARVVVAQYGGLLADSASVLVVVDQWVLRRDGRIRAGGTTLDIRLVVDEPEWAVTVVRPARPGRAVGGLSRAARRLLASTRVSLPEAAASDIRAGEINDVVLNALHSLSERRHLDVSVLRSGHPVWVFGTDRVSNHTEGRAVDVWALEGRPIVDMRVAPELTEFMKEASEVGAYQVGGPTDLDGGDTVYFSDDTHQDHIHLGFPT